MGEAFSITQEIQQQRQAILEKSETLDSKQELTFQSVVDRVKEEFDRFFEERHQQSNDSIERLDLNHRALIGDSEAEAFLMNEIESFLREHHLLNVSFPSYYDSLSQGIFHEIFRFGVLYKWYQMPHSPAAKFTGDEFWIEENDRFIRQPEKLPSKDTIMDFIRRFTATDQQLKVNTTNPTAEIALGDATRVKIMIPPAVYQPTIVFRQYTVNKVSFEDQASYGTIPQEDVSFYKVLSQLMLNTIVAGHIKSGKSTMLKTIYGARSDEDEVVLIEGKPESLLKRDYPNRLVHELYSHNRDINRVIDDALRIDHKYLIVQEVRGQEAEGAIAGTQRGRRGLLMTYHITDPQNTPEQLATHIVDEKPNRRLAHEIRRVSKALDLGITMESDKGQKRVTAIYEIGYNHETKQGFIQYLVQYDSDKKQWCYNANISQQLKKRIYDMDYELAEYFTQHLNRQAERSPIQGETYRYFDTKDV
ncbi:ATPase, T2SS/T4P/T4SS family [Piscibacillus sp. B03]|uniref:ATPase, T2SS/T4P/T4SS family n=1 Tax=Piscibacillus sp. B03 TaxID=3457430 RepID=UPI003FCC7CA7